MAGGLSRRRSVLLGQVVLACVVLASCGRAPHAGRPAWRDQAELACLRSGVVHESAYVVRGPAINGPGECGALAPFRVTALSDGRVAMTLPNRHGNRVYAVKLTCAMEPALEAWMRMAQRAAAAVYGEPIVEAHTLGSYSCRRMNNGTHTRHISEHAFADAIDMSGFRLADGREVMVRSGWRGSPQDQEFLRSVFVGSCEIFHTVLGPGSDGHHEDHFHLDLMRHYRGHHICRPVIKFSPRFAPPLTSPVRPPVPPSQLGPEPESPDPYAMNEHAPRRAVAMSVPRAPTSPAAPRAARLAPSPAGGIGLSPLAPPRIARADIAERGDRDVAPRGDRLDGRARQPAAPARPRASSVPKDDDRLDPAADIPRRTAYAAHRPPAPAATLPPGWIVGPQPLIPPQRIGPPSDDGAQAD